ncbi:MAG: apbE [Caloramator sp.]|jgi:thiamine biosynthesis lipoprotein|nr:apbE [Caloramator sp.]
MSAFREDSEVGLINKNAGIKEVLVSKDTKYVINRALEFNKISNKFDITIGPLSLLWSKKLKNNQIPSKEEVKNIKSLVDSRDVVIKEDFVSLKREDMMMDLGAIAKGYATDISKDILKAFSVKNVLLDFGGNIYTIGKNKGKHWSIGIQNPFSDRGEILGILSSTDESIVTSGINERYTKIGDKIYHHIIDKYTGYPVENEVASATIVSQSSIDADAFATIILLEGLKEGVKLIHYFNLEGIIVTKDKEIFVSRGLCERLNFICDYQIFKI